MMISLTIVIATCFLVGIAFTNNIARNYRIHSSFGLVIFLIATNSFSSLLNWNVGRSAFLVICLSILLIATRWNKLSSKVYFLREIGIEFFWLLLVAISLSPVFLMLSKDVASRNFDSYYATQDGIFLSDHSVLQSTGKVTEILPLIWGADSSDRYGISFFTSLILFMTDQNPWLAAKYIYIAIVAISIFTFRSLLLSFLKESEANLANLLTVVFTVSPFLILQSMYFMYGQTIALVFFPLFILLVRNYHSRFNQIWLMTIVVTSFISYPAISFILGLILFVLFSSSVLEQEDRKKNILVLIGIFITMSGMVTLAFGFNLPVVLDRVWTWIGGHLGLTQTLENTTNTIQIELFSQFDSVLALPLFLGLIPHPFTQKWNLTVGIGVLCLLSSYLIYSVVYFYKNLVPIDFKKSFIIIISACSFVPLISFIKGSGYIVFKTSTWFGPYLLVILIAVAIHKFGSSFNLRTGRILNLSWRTISYCVLACIFSTMVFNTSFQYSKKFASWNSFSQIPNSLDSASLSSIPDIGRGKVAIIAPTAEESTWISGMLPPSLVPKTLSLGQNEQALTEGLKTTCSLNKVQENFSQVTSILFSDKTDDVVPPIRFFNQPVRFGNWELHKVKDIQFLVVVNSGTFPPTLSTNYSLPLRDQVAMRWSGGYMCLGIFSALKKVQNVTVPFYFLNSGTKNITEWNIILNKFESKVQSEGDHLYLKLELQKGWNSLLLHNIDCPSQVDFDRLRGNADDRPLCVMFGRLTLNK